MGKISEIFNFDKIGGKIKNLAICSCWITILLIWIAAPIAFFLLFDSWLEELCWIPIVVAIVGPLLVWVESWLLYAFGQFVEDVHAMRDKEGTTEEVNAKLNEKAKREAEEKAKREAEEKEKYRVEERERWQKDNDFNDCAFSYDDFVDIDCPNCKKMLSFLKNEIDGFCPECETWFKIK